MPPSGAESGRSGPADAGGVELVQLQPSGRTKYPGARVVAAATTPVHDLFAVWRLSQRPFCRPGAVVPVAGADPADVVPSARIVATRAGSGRRRSSARNRKLGSIRSQWASAGSFPGCVRPGAAASIDPHHPHLGLRQASLRLTTRRPSGETSTRGAVATGEVVAAQVASGRAHRQDRPPSTAPHPICPPFVPSPRPTPPQPSRARPSPPSLGTRPPRRCRLPSMCPAGFGFRSSVRADQHPRPTSRFLEETVDQRCTWPPWVVSPAGRVGEQRGQSVEFWSSGRLSSVTSGRILPAGRCKAAAGAGDAAVLRPS